MNHLFCLALALSIFSPQDQNLPEAFHKLPDDVRAKATIIVSGTYSQGISPCIYMADGTRRRALESFFRVKKVYRGQVGGKHIAINSGLPAKEAGVKLEVGRKYLVLLRPDEESMNAIKAGDYVPACDALYDEEIIAIVLLK